MNLFTYLMHILGSSAVAYISARNLRDPLTRPNTLAGFQLAESGAVPFLEALQQRAIAEGECYLAEKLAIHAADERRHGQIFANAQDETRHAAYLYEALQLRLSADEVERVINTWRTRKVNALIAMVSNLIQKGGKTPALVQDGAPVEMDNQEAELAVQL